MTVIEIIILVITLINSAVLIYLASALQNSNNNINAVTTAVRFNTKSVQAVAKEANEDHERLNGLVKAHNAIVTALDDTPSKADFERLRCYVFNNVDSKYEAKHSTGSLSNKCLVAQMQDPTFHRGMIVEGWKDTDESQEVEIKDERNEES